MTTKKTTIMFGSSRDYNGFVGHSLLGVSYLRKLQDGLKKGRSIFLHHHPLPITVEWNVIPPFAVMCSSI